MTSIPLLYEVEPTRESRCLCCSVWIGIIIYISMALVNMDFMWSLTHHLRIGLVVSWAIFSIFLLWGIMRLFEEARIAWILMFLFLIPSMPIGLLVEAQLPIPYYLTQVAVADMVCKTIGFLFGVYAFVGLFLPAIRSLFVDNTPGVLLPWVLRSFGVLAISLGIFAGRKTMNGFAEFVEYEDQWASKILKAANHSSSKIPGRTRESMLAR